MKRYFTGVGSRDVTPEEAATMRRIGYLLARGYGYRLRSGKAIGSDSAFQQGVEKAISEGMGNHPEIYLAWRGESCSPEERALWPVSSEYDIVPAYHYRTAISIASAVHGWWDKLRRGGKALHTRNVYQVCGMDLESPSDFLIYCADHDKNGIAKGGTRTAVELAKAMEIPVFNIRGKEWNEIAGWLKPKLAA